MHYRLPMLLGGSVNPGNEAACEAVTAMDAQSALAIHDEPKRQQGLVAKLARVDRGPWAPSPIRWLQPPISVEGMSWLRG